jgi:hypothetical protein
MSQDAKFIICPFHGLVEAIAKNINISTDEGKEEFQEKNIQGFQCSKEGCSITRTERETE